MRWNYGVERTCAADQQLQRIAAWVRPLRRTNSRKLRLVTNARLAVRVLIATASRNRDISQLRGRVHARHLQGELGKVQARLETRRARTRSRVVQAGRAAEPRRGPVQPSLSADRDGTSSAMVVTTWLASGSARTPTVSPTNTGTSEWKLRSAQEQQIGGPCQLILQSKS